MSKKRSNSGITNSGKSADNKSNSLSSGTIQSIEAYTEGTKNSFSKNEVSEIKNAMTETNNTLYRVEDMSWMGENIVTGDEFEFDKPLKGFTNEWNGVKTVISEGDDAGLYGDTVAIFQTVGTVSHLDISKMSHNHSEESESLVGGKFVIVDEREGAPINGYNTWYFYVKQIQK